MWHFSSLPAPLVCRQQFAYSLESSLPRSQRAYLPNITSVGLEVISPLHYTYNTTQALVILEATSYHNGRSAERRSTCSAQHILRVIASHLHLCERPAPSSTHQIDAHSVLRVSTIYASTFNIFGSEAFTARILVCGMPDMVHLSSAFEKARTWLTSTKLVCSFAIYWMAILVQYKEASQSITSRLHLPNTLTKDVHGVFQRFIIHSIHAIKGIEAIQAIL
jgi:hypothetical protein